MKTAVYDIRLSHCPLLLLLWLLANGQPTKSAATLHEATPLPFPTIQQGRFVWAFNQFRSKLEAGNMQCVTRWNDNLASVAQKLADVCSVSYEPDQPDYGIIRIARPITHEVPTAAEVVEQIFVHGQADYSYEENKCDGDIGACENFKQLTWYRISEVGCGLTRCDHIEGYGNAGYMAVCITDVKAKSNQPPYAPGPSCSSCSRQNSKCTNGLCCPLDWQTAPIRRCTARPSEDNMVALHRFFNEGTSTNLLITDNVQVDFLRQQGMPYRGVIGRIARKPDKVCPHMRAVHHVYSDTFSGDYYTTDELIHRGRINKDIQDFGVIGYAVDGQGICDATVAIYEFYHKLGIVQLTNSTEMEKLLESDKGGYSYRGVSFTVWP